MAGNWLIAQILRRRRKPFEALLRPLSSSIHCVVRYIVTTMEISWNCDATSNKKPRQQIP